MLLWIESQPPSTIAVVVFGAVYLLAALTFCGAAILSRRPIAKALQLVTPGVLSPLGTILGILIAFLAVRVWSNLGPGTYRPRSQRVARGRHADELLARGRQGARSRGDRKTS
jgi:hypothetical protein